MADKNKVIAGDYEGKFIIYVSGIVKLCTSITKGFPLDNTTVEEFSY